MPLSFWRHWVGRGLSPRLIYRWWTVTYWEGRTDDMVWEATHS
jgi:hypothetical protein